MQILLTPQILRRFQIELCHAGKREIGGFLMGEHVQDEIFRVVDISVQHFSGSQSCFVRHPHEHRAQLQDFFTHTNQDYTRFNYMGEWHSHPNFNLVPSSTDVRTMQSLINDPDVGANFLVLLITKVDKRKNVEMSAVAFRKHLPPVCVPVTIETANTAQTKSSLFQWLLKLFKG